MKRTTKHKRKTRLTKKRRKRRSLRRIANEFGVDGLYFYRRNRSWGDIGKIECSSMYDGNYDSGIIRAPGNLRALLKRLSGPDKNTKITHRNEGLEFCGLDELKKHILIKKLAGI